MDCRRSIALTFELNESVARGLIFSLYLYTDDVPKPVEEVIDLPLRLSLMSLGRFPT